MFNIIVITRFKSLEYHVIIILYLGVRIWKMSYYYPIFGCYSKHSGSKDE
jgi:hypothetical protein